MKYGGAYIQFLISKFFKSCLLWDTVVKYGTAVQATADNIIRRMRLARPVTAATDTHNM